MKSKFTNIRFLKKRENTGVDPKVVVTGSASKPYYLIEYLGKNDGKTHIGYGSYSYANVLQSLREAFGIASNDIRLIFNAQQ